VNPVGPGWADPGTGSFADPRFHGRDDKPYGPLPRDWTHFEGAYFHSNQVVIAYTVGDAHVLELPGYERSDEAIAFSRTLNIGKSSRDLLMRLRRNKSMLHWSAKSPPTSSRRMVLICFTSRPTQHRSMSNC
jgi:hypothetical protein